MKLIKLDLNQTVTKAQLEEIRDEQKRWVIFGLICTLFIASLIWLYIINERMNYIISERESTIENIIEKTEELTDKGKINLSKIDINNLYNLQEARIYWSDKLIELSKITPEDMVITKLEFRGKLLNISAIANLDTDQKEFKVVESFMKMIDANEEFNKDFKDIKFGFLDKEYSNKQELLSFKIEARLK